MNMMLLMIGLLTAASVALTVGYAYERVTGTRRVVAQRLAPKPQATGLALRSGLRTASRSRIPLVDRLPISPVARERMHLELLRAGDPLSVNEYLGLQTACAAGFALLGVVLMIVADDMAPWLGMLLVFVLLIAGWHVPRYFIKRAQKKRDEKIAEQLPDALTAISKSLRAGTGLLQALNYAATETPAPLGKELQITIRDLQLGADPSDTFAALSDRVGNKDLDIAVTAILIQRNVGGNLSEILGNVTRTIRDRVKIESEIRVLTSRQRLQGNLVAALPIVVALAFISLNPEVGSLLYETGAGRIALAIGIGFELLGLWLIRRLAVIEY